MSDPQGIPPSTWNLRLTAALCALFVPIFGGFAMCGVYMAISQPSLAAKVIVGVPLITLGGGATWFLIRTIWKLYGEGWARHPWVYADERGLWVFDFPRWRYRGVVWEDVESIELSAVKETEVLVVVPKNPDQYLRELGVIRRLSYKRYFGKMAKLPALSIATASLSVDGDEALDWCLNEWKKWLDAGESAGDGLPQE